jgi:hypothetical protein
MWLHQMAKGEWCIAPRLIQWLGPGQPECMLVYGFSVEKQGPPKPARIYDGRGEVVGASVLMLRGQNSRTVGQVLGFGGAIPVVASHEEAMALRPGRLLVGISPPGGRVKARA